MIAKMVKTVNILNMYDGKNKYKNKILKITEVDGKKKMQTDGKDDTL